MQQSYHRTPAKAGVQVGKAGLLLSQERDIVIVSEAFRGKRYAVLGLARSGRATVEALVASGAAVVAWDEKEEAREALLEILPVPGRIF